MNDSAKTRDGRPTNCHGCKHLVTTWDPRFPYGCRVFGMQSRVLPCIEVRRETGQECAGYEARSHRAGA